MPHTKMKALPLSALVKSFNRVEIPQPPPPMTKKIKEKDIFEMSSKKSKKSKSK